MQPIYDVFFWSTVATATIVLEMAVFISRRRKRKIVYAIAGVSAILLFEAPRVIIPLLPQPRFNGNPMIFKIVGMAIFLLGLSIAFTAFAQLMNAKRHGWRLQTSGVYGIVRHPMYLGDVLWYLGWSIAYRAVYAIALTPLWYFLRYSLAVLEEEKLVERYGEEYIEYMRRVRHRMLPL